jgi:hypothetical protein
VTETRKEWKFGGKRTTGVNECARKEETSGNAGHVGMKGRRPEVEFDCHGLSVGLAVAGLAGPPGHARRGGGSQKLCIAPPTISWGARKTKQQCASHPHAHRHRRFIAPNH